MEEENTFKILVATDNHLGYMENDPVRGEDSFKAFKEVLDVARQEKVDFILLGGDLFHENKPSRSCMYKTMGMLRTACMGDSPCHIEFLSDQSESFGGLFPNVNYEDPNFNISIPIFSIHGNHDEPSGDGNLCALDLLAQAGLVNYFGKQQQLEEVEIKPLLMRKGTSKLALYGLGNIRDARLNRIFQEKKVKMFRPAEEKDDWFNILVLHQNRAAHSVKNYLPTEYLDRIADFVQLLLWGHEHECIIDPQQERGGYYITQPGSSVATSLCEGEAVKKHIGLLQIQGDEFSLKKIPLKTVRPFIMETITLKDNKDLDCQDVASVREFIKDKVDDLIEKARSEWLDTNSNDTSKVFPLPLVRLKVDYAGGFKSFNPQRFGQDYVERVANPKDILHFYRKRVAVKRAEKGDESSFDISDLVPSNVEDAIVETLISDMLKKQKLEFIPENELTDIISDFVQKQEKDSIEKYINKSVATTKQMLLKSLEGDVEDDSRLQSAILEAKDVRSANYSMHVHPTQQLQRDPKLECKGKLIKMVLVDYDEGWEEENVYVEASAMVKKKPARKAAASKKSKPKSSDEDEEMAEEQVVNIKKSRAKVQEIISASDEETTAVKRSAASSIIDLSEDSVQSIPVKKGRSLPTGFDFASKKKAKVTQSTLDSSQSSLASRAKPRVVRSKKF